MSGVRQNKLSDCISMTPTRETHTVKYLEHKSEIAQLRQRIELECAAMHLALEGSATVARHNIIAHRHSALDDYQKQLEQFVGCQQALQISLEIYDQAITDHKDHQI
jgi:hypothetical protein